MATFGQGVRPELGRMDFSPIARGGEAMGAGIGQGIESAGQSIGQSINRLNEMKRLEQEQKKAAKDAISSAKPLLEFAKTLPNMPQGMLDRLESFQEVINNEELPLSQRAAMADQASKIGSIIFSKGFESMLESQQPRQPEYQSGDMFSLPDGTLAKSVFEKDTGRTLLETPQGRIPLAGSGAAPYRPDASQGLREEKIGDLVNLTGIDRVTAIDIVDGNKKIVTDPVNGTSMIYNVRTGETQEINLPGDVARTGAAETTKPPEGAPSASINLWDMANKTTGVIPGILNMAQRGTGQIGLNIADPKIQESMQVFRSAKQSLIRALVLSPRFNATEMERVGEEIDISPSMLKDPQTLRSQMRGVDLYLRDRLANELAVANDPAMPASSRKDAEIVANSISNFLRILGVPQEEKQPGNIPKGITPEEWNNMTEADRALFKNG